MVSTARRAGTWQDTVATARAVFGTRSYAIFETLLCGWVLAPGRRTITAMICAGDPAGLRAHDA